MLWFIVLSVWYASACAQGYMPARDKPFYSEATHAREFEAFKATYNKQYATPEEERRRFEVFKNNLNSINELNAQYKETVYGITKFSDLTTQEFVAQYTGLLVVKTSESRPPPLQNLTSVEVPDSFDWRDKNVVTSVKDQGVCQSGWAFGIIACLESQYALKYNKQVDFSEQQLIDCDTNDYGCKGGFFENTIGYLITNGVMKNADYPYKGKQGKCNYDARKVEVHVKSFRNYNAPEEEIKKVLYTKGPVAVTIDGEPLLHYKGGVLQDCKHINISHAVLLVGYGKENGVDYWLFKNSWGESVGEKGYFKMARGVECLGLGDGEITMLEV